SIAGVGLIGATGAATARGLGPAGSESAGLIDAPHLPRLRTRPGEQVTLRYDVYCAPPGPDPEGGAPCDAAGTVFVRRGNAGPFQPLPPRDDPRAHEGRHPLPSRPVSGAREGRRVADVPGDLAGARDGFSYYGVLRSRTSGVSTVLP